MFVLVSSPHYLGEGLMWPGWALTGLQLDVPQVVAHAGGISPIQIKGAKPPNFGQLYYQSITVQPVLTAT